MQSQVFVAHTHNVLTIDIAVCVVCPLGELTGVCDVIESLVCRATAVDCVDYPSRLVDHMLWGAFKLYLLFLSTYNEQLFS